MAKRTPLYEQHVQSGAKMVDFGGWDMPLHYGSQLEEHHQVRRDAGMFDVSHMTVVDLRGERVRAFLRTLLANDVDKLRAHGKALYSCMLNGEGTVIDDLITYYLDETWFRMVVNAATRDKDLTWIQAQAQPFGVDVAERRDLAMIAVQGPNARAKVLALLPERARDNVESLGAFFAAIVDDRFIARTGYTGEDGFEIVLPAREAPIFWRQLQESGVQPIGLGARDTLRLEAGMNLYGTDMDESTTPLESGLAWTVAWEPTDRRFIGRAPLETQRAQGVPRKLVGLVLEGKGVLRGHQQVQTKAGTGEITSGTFSPTLNQSIALARVPTGVALGDTVEVIIRDKPVAARVVKYPFVRNGKSCL